MEIVITIKQRGHLILKSKYCNFQKLNSIGQMFLILLNIHKWMSHSQIDDSLK